MDTSHKRSRPFHYMSVDLFLYLGTAHSFSNVSGVQFLICALFLFCFVLFFISCWLRISLHGLAVTAIICFFPGPKGIWLQEIPIIWPPRYPSPCGTFVHFLIRNVNAADSQSVRSKGGIHLVNIDLAGDMCLPGDISSNRTRETMFF